MSAEELDNFLPTAPVSVRAIDSSWAEKRATMSGLTTQEVIAEIADHLVTRLDHNLDESRNVLLYLPENKGDPYILALPLKLEATKEKRFISEGKLPPKAFIKSELDNDKIRNEFETLVKKKYPQLNEFVFIKDSLGNYLATSIKSQWEGFWLYHESQTTVCDTVNKKMYEKSVGRFIIGKIAPSGAVLFNKAPYRHPTRMSATEEALRLSNNYDSSFVIYRAIGVVGV